MKKIDLDDLVNSIPNNLTNIEKARYLYIELCRSFIFDQKFCTRDPNQMERIFFSEIDFNNITDNKAVCSMLSKMYMYMLEKIGIKSNGVYLPNTLIGHIGVVMQIEENRKNDYYYVSITDDLMNVKLGYKTKGFCKKPSSRKHVNFADDFSELSDDELYKIDTKLGYTYNINSRDEGMYLNSAVEILSKEMRDPNLMRQYIKNNKNLTEDIPDSDLLKYKIEFIVNYINDFGKKLSGIEKKDFLFDLVKECLTEEEYKVFGKYNCNDNNKRILTILKVKGPTKKDDIFYLIQDVGDIEKIDEKKVKDLLENGVKPFWTHVQILSNESIFDEINKQYNYELSLYAQKNPKEVRAAMLFQSCEGYINLYKKYKYNKIKNEDNSMLINKIKQELYSLFENLKEYKEYKEYSNYGVEIIHDILNCLKNSESKCDFDNFYKVIGDVRNNTAKQAKPVLELMEKYKKELCECAKTNNMLLISIDVEKKNKKRFFTKREQSLGKLSNLATSKYDNMDKNDILKIVKPGMEILPNVYEMPMYLTDVDNVKITSENAFCKIEGHISYVEPNGFTPIVRLKNNPDYNTVCFKFDNGWKNNESTVLNNDHPEFVKEEAYNGYDFTSELKRNQFFVLQEKLSPQEKDLLRNSNTCLEELNYLIECGKIINVNTILNIKPFSGNASVKTVTIFAVDVINNMRCKTTDEIRKAKKSFDDMLAIK